MYRATYCARTDPLPLLPSGPGGVGGVASRRTRHPLIISPGLGCDRLLVAVGYEVFHGDVELRFVRTLLHELNQDIGLDVDGLAGLQAVQIGPGIGVRNDGYTHHAALSRVRLPSSDGQADAFNRDGSLFHHVAAYLRGDRNPEPPVGTHRLQA